MSLASIHNDYLDPDKHLNHPYDDEEAETLTSNQKRQVKRIRAALEKARSEAYDPKNRTPYTKESLLDGWPSGDFSCDGEPEDVGNAWNCGDSDCETGWHNSIQCVEMGRKDGKTWLIVLEDSCAGDGDYQPCAGWDEREGDEIDQSTLNDLWFHFEGRMIDHFYGWGIYHLDCAETGKDPLREFRYGSPMTAASAIKAAKENLRYLRMKPRKK